MGFPGGSLVKNSPANAGDARYITRSEISLGEGNSNPFQYSCLGNPTDRGAWWATVQGGTESATTEHAHDNALLLDLNVVIS